MRLTGTLCYGIFFYQKLLIKYIIFSFALILLLNDLYTTHMGLCYDI